MVHCDCCRLVNNLIYTQKEGYIAEEDVLKGLNISGSIFTHILKSFMIAIVIITCEGRRGLRTCG